MRGKLAKQQAVEEVTPKCVLCGNRQARGRWLKPHDVPKKIRIWICWRCLGWGIKPADSLGYES